MMTTTPNPLDVTCGECGSKPGKRCYGNGEMRRTHSSRASKAEHELRAVAADALEAATRERDAAVAAIERVRAEADAYAEQPDVMELCGAVAQALRTALDEAPEPEGRWGYRGRLQSCGYVAEGYISAEHAMNGLRVELEDHPYLAMDDTAIVERARVREWIPVEGEKP